MSKELVEALKDVTEDYERMLYVMGARDGNEYTRKARAALSRAEAPLNEGLEELARLSEKATRGPWKVYEQAIPHHRGGQHTERMIVTAWDHPQLKGPDSVVRLSTGIPEVEGDPWVSFCNIDAANAAFIVACVNHVRAALNGGDNG